MNKLIKIVCSALLVFSSFAQAGQQGTENLDAVMKAKLVDILAAVNQSGDAAQAKLHGAIDFPSITRGVLGKHFEASSDEQRQGFQVEFEKSMVALLKAATETVGDYDIQVTGSKLHPKNDKRGQAYATVKTQDGQNIDLIASVALLSGEWKVRNLIFGGVNLGKTYRSQFDQLVQQQNGDLDQAIAAWAANAVENGVAAGN